MSRTKKTKKSTKKLSAEERARRREQRQQALAALYPHPLLYPRAHAARLLNCSVQTVIRLEQRGVLTPIKLDKESKSAPTFYTHDNLTAVAGTSFDVPKSNKLIGA